MGGIWRSISVFIFVILSCKFTIAQDQVQKINIDELKEHHEEWTEVSLVPQSQLERHDLPSTQRSWGGVAFRFDHTQSNVAYNFGIVGAYVSWGAMRFRTCTLWLSNNLISLQSAPGVKFFASGDWELVAQILLGFNMPDVESNYFSMGGGLTVLYHKVWGTLGYESAQVQDNIDIDRFGLSIGMAF